MRSRNADPLGSALTTDIGNVHDEGEALILATEAREARAAVHLAGAQLTGVVFGQLGGLLVAGLGLLLGDPHYEVVELGVAVTVGMEFFRRRAMRRVNQARELAWQLGELYSAASERDRQSTS